MGLLNYLSRFIPDLATWTDPLRHLTQAGVPWTWNNTQENAFNKLKALISEHARLAHFSNQASCSVIVDASPVGLGAILTKENSVGVTSVIAYASKALTKTEQNYSQTEREAYAVVWACEKFHIYLYGKAFTIVTDHKPLLQIYSPKGKPSPRVLRWSLRLLPYQFTLEYSPGDSNPADVLSRQPLQDSNQDSGGEDEAEHFINHTVANAIPKAITLSELHLVSSNDEELQDIRKAIRSGKWTDPSVKAYVMLKEELAIKGGLVLRGTRLIIPKDLRQRVIGIAHEGHQGIRKTKELMRTKVWWPKIDRDIENHIQHCISCRSVQNTAPLEPLKMTDMPPVWEQVHNDICGPLPNGESILGVVDAGSRWPEAFIMRSITSSQIIKCLQFQFSAFGIPKQIISDNGPQFTSEEFKDFCQEWGIEHRRVTPYYPQANSEIERLFRTLMKTVKLAHAEGKEWKAVLRKYLLTYRNTPHSTTKQSPASLIFNRPIQDKLPTLPIQPTKTYLSAMKRDKKAKEIIKSYADRNAKPSLIEVGDSVLMKQNRKNKLSTNFALTRFKVVQRLGGSVWVRHPAGVVQMRNVTALVKIPDEDLSRSVDEPPTPAATDEPEKQTADVTEQQRTPAAPRRSVRPNLGRAPHKLDL